MPQALTQSAKRGDTLIEVMFAFAIFSLVAIMSVTMMNLGLAASERSLEVVTVRDRKSTRLNSSHMA